MIFSVFYIWIIIAVLRLLLIVRLGYALFLENGRCGGYIDFAVGFNKYKIQNDGENKTNKRNF